MNRKDSETLDLAVDRAISNGLMETIADGGGFRPTQKALKLVGLKTFKGLSKNTAMQKIIEILSLPENEEYGKEAGATRYTYLPIRDDKGKAAYGICINGKPSPELTMFDTEEEAKEYIRQKNAAPV